MEIKFRLYSKELNQFFYMTLGVAGDYINLIKSTDGRVYMSHPNGDPIPVEVSVYIGHRDDNGIEIFEGDIVQNTSSKEVFEIFYDEKMAQFGGIDRTKQKIGGILVGPTLFPLKGKIIIIGNVFQFKDEQIKNKKSPPARRKSTRSKT